MSQRENIEYGPRFNPLGTPTSCQNLILANARCMNCLATLPRQLRKMGLVSQKILF